MGSGRKERRSQDPEVQKKREAFSADKEKLSVGPNTLPTGPLSVPGGKNSFPQGTQSGGWGLGDSKSQPATGTPPAVNPFMIPKASGLNITSQVFPANYFVEWDLSRWRTACDLAMNMGYTEQFDAMTTWVFECSPFVQSMFNTLAAALDSIPFYFEDPKGNNMEDWTEELCNKPWQMQLRREILFSFFWGFTGINFDPEKEMIYKYPQRQIDPINRLLRGTTFDFYNGMPFYTTDNLLFIQPNTNKESFLGWMPPIARSFIQINQNKISWRAAGDRFAYPMMTVGYPQGDGAVDPNTGQERNDFKQQAEEVIANADPTRGLAYPYTIGPKGEIVKSLEIGFEGTGANARAHSIYTDFNEAEKNEIREMILGGTLTADVGNSGSRALGEVQERKLEKMLASKIEFVVAYLNADYKRKIAKFYKKFPEGNFSINRSKQLTIDEIVSYSQVVTQNGLRLTTAFFEANGLQKEFIEEAPTPPKQGFDEKENPLKAGDITKKDLQYSMPEKKNW